ncbi:MAG: glycine--tRNA ligase subunit beta [Nitrospirae bacterium]|nr:glycine--tRNA ligase subunit beta [Nitrospirota bacterium]
MKSYKEKNSELNSSLLLEIGTEEIPARFIPDGIRLLKEEIAKIFTDAGIDFGNVLEYATPRRLSIYIDSVSKKQKDRTKEVLGPPKKVSFDEKGNPTQAAIGFAKSCNVDVKNLKVLRTERGEYISATIEEKGRKTIDVLAGALPVLITSIQFPKSMRWGSGSLRFVRPIRWITAILGNEIIPFKIDGLKSSDISYGHRFISHGPFKVEDITAYLQLLSNNYVVADPIERKRIISEGIKNIESKLGCRVHEDKELLDTVTFLVEYPTVVLGNFDSEYLSLPKELLITVMKSHQKYFSLDDKDGNLLHYFIVVSNTKSENVDIVKRGAERVLKARLEDARFYYEEDQKKLLWDYVESLKKVTFHGKLGSVYEKVERMAFLCSFISDTLNPQLKEKLLRAVMLCKADLVTGIVREFPELQGYMGMVYAKNSGEDEDVAEAIYEHYMPKFSGDFLPRGEIGSIISLADKLDNIVSFFLLGLAPTGSEDPFALRRQAIGIINILLHKDYPIPLNILINKALQGIESYLPARRLLTDDILEFFYQRLEGMLLAEGYSYDTINAVFSIRSHDIKDIKQRIEVLSEMRESPEFPQLLTSAKRVYNILAKVMPAEVKEDLLTELAEQDLYSAAEEVGNSLKGKNYNSLFELEKPINIFFDNVLVMDKRPEIRENRLALLSSIKMLFDSLGDFSKIITE